MKKLFLLLLLLMSYGVGFAQVERAGSTSNAQLELPQVIPPSPTVANLMHFEEVPVSYYTGQPNISIPLYSKTLSKDLGINIALSYNTQGVKIDNRSGWTGTGWSLNAGGVISRTVRGLPDEKQKGAGLPIIGMGVLHNPDFWNYNNSSLTDQARFRWKAKGESADIYDYQLDLFQFNVMGLSGRFIIVKDIYGTPEAKLLSKNQNISIAINHNPITFELYAFIVTDTNGNRYIFNVIEELQTEHVIGIEFQNGEQTLLGQGLQTTSKNAWYLSKIETSNFKELANFEYTDDYTSYNLSIDRTYNDIINPTYTWPNWNNVRQNSYNSSILPPKKRFTYVHSYGNTKVLSKITFRDLSSIEFVNSGNHPETTGAVLDNIVIKDRNTQNKQFTLNYDITDRLWLVGIEEKAGTKTSMYTLEYTDKINLLPYDSTSDDWGYNSDGLPEISRSTCNRSPFNKDIIKKGLLERIIYPTGGVKEFIFEHNTITYQSQIGGLFSNDNPQAVKLTDDQYQDLNPDNWILGGGFQFGFDSNIHNSAANPTLTPEIITIEQSQEIVFKRSNYTINMGTCTNTEEGILFNSLIKIISTDPNNNYVNNIRLDKDEVRFMIPQGTYEVRLYFLDNCAQMDIDICFNIKTFTRTVSRFVYGGGVRIKDIIFKDNTLTSTMPSRKISYDYRDANDKYSSSGAIDGNINGLLKNYEDTYTNHLFFVAEACELNPVYGYSLDFSTRSKTINVELTQGQYVGYKTVKVFEQNKGFTKYTFTSAQDYASPSNVFNYPYTPAPNIDFKRGLLLKKEVFKHSTIPTPVGVEPNRKLSEVVNSYEFEEEDIAPTYRLYTDEGCIWKRYYTDYNSYSNNSPENRLKQCSFGFNTSCGSDCIISYSNCGTIPGPYTFLSDNVKTGWAKLIESQTKDYFYDELDNQTLTDSRQTFRYEPFNFQIREKNTFIEENGVEQHFRENYFYPVGYTLSGLSPAIRTKLKDINKINEVLAIENYKNTTKTSTIINQYREFEPNLILPEKVQSSKNNDALENRLTYHNYDDYSNPLEVSKTDGTHIIYIWGYNQTQPIAKIENTSYNGMSASLQTAITTAKAASDSDSNATTEDNLRAALTAIRNHQDLSNAQVTTYTYDPLIGVTSITDPRGDVIYYEYDSFNRLKHVKDKDGNILSENEYNYRAQN